MFLMGDEDSSQSESSSQIYQTLHRYIWNYHLIASSHCIPVAMYRERGYQTVEAWNENSYCGNIFLNVEVVFGWHFILLIK